jgi:D-3-phosphoglycerate dehydrogenase
LEAGPKLKVLSKHGVGLDNVDLKRATELGIQVTYRPCSNTNSVTEHTIAMLLALATDMVHMDHETRKGNWWSRHTTKAMEISGKVLGIVGMGKIGRLVAAKAALGLEMKVIGYDSYLPREAVPKEIEQVYNLEEVFERSDFVSLHMPLTPETQQFIGCKLFKLMKPTAYLINCARGGVINEKELYTDFKDGWISGAGLDCFIQEATQPNNPLFALDNVIVSPHSAAQTKEAIERMSLHVAIGVDEVLSGKIPSWPGNHFFR